MIKKFVAYRGITPLGLKTDWGFFHFRNLVSYESEMFQTPKQLKPAAVMRQCKRSLNVRIAT